MDKELDLTYDRLLGEGSYGKVFLVKQQNGEKFAVKEIDLTKCDEDGKTQALGESAILARIKHESILQYIESVINDDCLYIITEYCGGGDMEDYLQTVARCRATIPESLVSEWILQLGEALKYLHDMKILHRDMKTKNIFLLDDLTVKLGDMGIAKVLDMNQSKADTFIGTPSYMSPELFTGKSYNHKTDIWGLGCCAYEMMTLKRAFQGKALWTLIREIKQGKELELPDQYSLDIRTLVKEMMCQAPEGRPSAREIVEIDLLLYHRGKSKHEVEMLPRPNQEVLNKDKKKSRNSANLSGSFKSMLQDKNRAEEEDFRTTLTQVCAKINTLQRTGSSMVECVDTFVYHGEEEDSDGELEASGTVLNSSRLKEFTQQLDTMVYKGDGGDSDSDYSTGGSLVNKGPVNNVEDDDEEDVNVTLIRQYSSHLEETEGAESDGAEQGEEDAGRGPSPPVPEPKKTTGRYVKHVASPRYSHAAPPVSPSKVSRVSQKQVVSQDNEDPDFVSKYQFKGLRDTLAIRPDKRWKKNYETDLLNRLRNANISENSISEDMPEKGEGKKTPKSHRPISMASTLTSTGGSYGGTKTKTSDPRLNKSVSFDGSDTRTKTARTKISDRIAQSAKNKGDADVRLRSPKKAFSEDIAEQDGSYTLTSSEQVKHVMSHLRDNLTPCEEAGQSELTDTLRSTGSEEGSQNQDSDGKGRKKKIGVLKKQARKKSVDQESTKEIDVVREGETNIKLFTRAQTASFSKDDDDSISARHTNGVQTHQDLNNVLTRLHEDSSETLATEQLLNIQRELANALGVDNLRQVLDIMSMVKNEQEMQLHVKNLVGPRLFEEYKQHLVILRFLELRGASGS